MAAPGAEQIQAMIDVSIQRAVGDIDNRFGLLLGSQVSRQEAETALLKIIEDAKTEFENSRQRSSDLVEGYNAQFLEHKRVIESIPAEIQQYVDSTGEARKETKSLKEDLVAMEAQHAKLRSDLDTEFGLQRAARDKAAVDIEAWAAGHKEETRVAVMAMLRQSGSGGSMDQGKGQGQGQ